MSRTLGSATTGERDQRAHEDPGHHPLLIIGDDERRTPLENTRTQSEELRRNRGFDRTCDLAIRAHHLLLLGHDARFHRGRPARNRHQTRVDAALPRRLSQTHARKVVPHHADQGHAPAERLHVERDVRGAPEAFGLLSHPHHRHRRFGRNARYLTEHKHVQHRVAHHRHAAALERTENRLDPCPLNPRLHCSRTRSESAPDG